MNVFMKENCTLVEINPLGRLGDGSFRVCDAKMTIDDNSRGLHKEVFAMEDLT